MQLHTLQTVVELLYKTCNFSFTFEVLFYRCWCALNTRNGFYKPNQQRDVISCVLAEWKAAAELDDWRSSQLSGECKWHGSPAGSFTNRKNNKQVVPKVVYLAPCCTLCTCLQMTQLCGRGGRPDLTCWVHIIENLTLSMHVISYDILQRSNTVVLWPQSSKLGNYEQWELFCYGP